MQEEMENGNNTNPHKIKTNYNSSIENNSEEEFFKINSFQQDFDIQDDFSDISESLKQQVNSELRKEKLALKNVGSNKKRMKKHKILKAIGIIFALLMVSTALLIGTKAGRGVLYNVASHFIYNSMNKAKSGDKSVSASSNKSQKTTIPTEPPKVVDKSSWKGRYEDYVTNYLIFGIEEIGGAKNTDSMIIASINSKDNSIKLTSIMRDSYVSIKGYHNNKLNSAFSRGGTDLLINTIESNYKIHIDGYAYVNFKSFESIINSLGGISIELGPEEANYLNHTNYISNRAYRNVHAGVNNLNGNQALGYSRVRHVQTLGGVNDDYGRTLRQRRVLQAIFDKYKSQSIFKLLPIMQKCLGNVTTDLTQKQIESSLESIVENNIRTMTTYRIPADNMFQAPKVYEGVTYPIVLDWDKNIKELYKNIFLDTDEEAAAKLAIEQSKHY